MWHWRAAALGGSTSKWRPPCASAPGRQNRRNHRHRHKPQQQCMVRRSSTRSFPSCQKSENIGKNAGTLRLIRLTHEKKTMIACARWHWSTLKTVVCVQISNYLRTSRKIAALQSTTNATSTNVSSTMHPTKVDWRRLGFGTQIQYAVDWYRIG